MNLRVATAYYGLVFIWGTTWLAMKVSIGETPLLSAASRFMIASCVLALYLKLNKRSLKLPPGSGKTLAVVTFGNFFLGYGLTYWSLQFVYSNLTSLLWATFPIQVALFAHFMIAEERLNWTTAFSLVVAFGGTLLIMNAKEITGEPRALAAAGIILVSVAIAAYANVYFKRGGTHLDPLVVNLYGMFFSSWMLLGVGLLLENPARFPFRLVPMAALFYLAVIGSALGFSLYFWLFRHLPVVKLGYITFIVPVVATLLGWTVLGEHLSSRTFLGGGLILIGVILPDLKYYKLSLNSYK